MPDYTKAQKNSNYDPTQSISSGNTPYSFKYKIPVGQFQNKIDKIYKLTIKIHKTPLFFKYFEFLFFKRKKKRFNSQRK